MSMLGYMEGAMHGYQHKIPTHTHHAPHKCERKDYGSRTKCDKPILPPDDRKIYKRWWEFSLLRKSSRPNPTMLVTLVTLSSDQ